MASYENAYRAICQKCKKSFDLDLIVVNSVNIDFAGHYREKLLNNTINRVICPHCKCNFTYERPNIAYSFKHKFAVLCNFDFDEKVYCCGNHYLFEMFKINNMKFRIVNYMCETSEKFRILLSGLDDFKIEYLKYKFFDKDFFTDKTNKILLFDKISDDQMLFNLYTDTDEIIKTFSIPYVEYLNLSFNYDLPYKLNGKCLWYKIDTKYIKEYINE